MAELFSRTLYVGWSDVDANGHMANTAYLSKVVDVRMMFFEEQGFTMRDFERLRLGPVVMRDELEYFREFRMLELIRITLSLAGLSEDGSRFRLRNELFKEDEKLAARLSGRIRVLEFPFSIFEFLLWIISRTLWLASP